MRGSTSNVIAALASFFLPGLGQLIQGRILAAVFYCLLALLLGGVTFFIGFAGYAVGGIIACVDAALWRGPKGAA